MANGVGVAADARKQCRIFEARQCHQHYVIIVSGDFNEAEEQSASIYVYKRFFVGVQSVGLLSFEFVIILFDKIFLKVFP